MQSEYLVNQQINFTFTYFLMSFVPSWLRFHQLFHVMEVNYLLRALSSREFFKYESVIGDFALLLIKFMTKRLFRM